MDKRVTAYILRYLLENKFSSKADMARKLGIEYRSLLRVFAKLDNAKAGTIVLDKAILYCARYCISIDAILKEFITESRGMEMIRAAKGNGAACKRLTVTAPHCLSEEGEGIFCSLVRFLQYVSACVCPCCECWCNPWNADTLVDEKDCYIGTIACSIIKHVSCFYDERAHGA